jgi:rare lipoprotein A
MRSLALVITTGYLIINSFPPAVAETATYYADRFQGQRTASGEIYSGSEMTSAHPSLPLGTQVRVTNLQNGRSVVVRVNDRCHCGIDLSKAAAEEIDLIQAGRTEVRVDILPSKVFVDF